MESYLQSDEELPGYLSSLPDLGREATREFIRERKDQYTRFNSMALQLVSDVFDALEKHFAVEDRRLRLINREHD